MKLFGKSLLILAIIVIFSFNVSARTETIFLEDYELTYEFDEDDVEAGETFTLRIDLLNTDSQDKEDIRLELDSSYPLDIDGDDTWELDILEADETRTRTFRVDVDERALDQEYEIEFTLEDSEDDYDEEINIDVNSILADIVVSDVVSVPATITPDIKDIKLTITLDNIGGGDALATRSELILPGGFQPADSFSFIESLAKINSGEQKEAEFFLDTLPGLEGGLYQGQLRLFYEDEEDNPRTQTINFDIIVRDRPMFLVQEIKLDPTGVVSGTDGNRISISVLNIGQEDGEETSIRVFETNDLPLGFDEKTQRVGTIQPGESGAAVFNFEVDSGTPGNTYLLKIQTRTITEGNVITEEFTVPVRILDEEPTNFLLLGFSFLPIILLIVLVFLFYRIRKKSKD